MVERVVPPLPWLRGQFLRCNGWLRYSTACPFVFFGPKKRHGREPPLSCHEYLEGLEGYRALGAGLGLGFNPLLGRALSRHD